MKLFESCIQQIKCRDIRVSKGIDTIFYGKISVWRFFGINLEKSAIFPNISHDQRGVKSMCYSDAIVPPFFFFASEGI